MSAGSHSRSRWIAAAVVAGNFALPPLAATAQDQSGDAAKKTAVDAAPAAESTPGPAAPTIPGRAVARELEKLYADLLIDFNDGAGTALSELIQVHHMAIEARGFGGSLYQKLGIEADWRGAATARASRLAELIERRYADGGMTLLQVRLARASMNLTEARHTAHRAAAAAEAKSHPRSSRRVVLPPPSRPSE